MHRLVTATVLTAGIAATLACQSASTSPAPPEALERPFAHGGRVTMNLTAGDYAISGAADAQIRVRWEARDAAEVRGVKVEIDVNGRDAHILTEKPRRVGNFRATIEIPTRSDVDVSLSAGELRLRGVEGNKDISAWAGELNIDMGPTASYRRVDASVTAGELRAQPFKVSKDGLFRSFTWDGSGRYNLRARLTAGELTINSGEPGPSTAIRPRAAL